MKIKIEIRFKSNLWRVVFCFDYIVHQRKKMEQNFWRKTYFF